MADIIDVPLLDEVVWDGIIGLAFPNEQLSSQGITPLMDNMMTSSILTNNLFAYYIGMNQGAVTFGGVDKKYIASKDDDKFRFAVVTEKVREVLWNCCCLIFSQSVSAESFQF